MNLNIKTIRLDEESDGDVRAFFQTIIRDAYCEAGETISDGDLRAATQYAIDVSRGLVADGELHYP